MRDGNVVTRPSLRRTAEGMLCMLRVNVFVWGVCLHASRCGAPSRIDTTLRHNPSAASRTETFHTRRMMLTVASGGVHERNDRFVDLNRREWDSHCAWPHMFNECHTTKM